MSRHPAYPSSAEIRAFARATELIGSDLETLATAWQVLSVALRILDKLPELDYPHRRVSIEDFRTVIRDAITDIDGEGHRLANEPIEPVWEVQ